MMRKRWSWLLIAVVVGAVLGMMFVRDGGRGPSDESLEAQGSSATRSRRFGAKSSSPRLRSERRQNIVAAPVGMSVYTGSVFAADGAALGTTVTVTLETMPIPTSTAEDTISTSALVGPEGGEYRFEIHPRFSPYVKANGAGFISMEAAASGLPNDPPRGTARVVVRDFAMQRGAEISGRLVDAANAPLSGTVTAIWTMEKPIRIEDFEKGISMSDDVAESAPDGAFRLRAKAGSVMLVASSPGYGALTKTVTAPATGVEFRFGDGALVEGRVLHVGSNDSAAGVTVHLAGEQMEVPSNRLLDRARSTAMTDEQGNFLFRGVEKGRYTLRARGEKLFPMTGEKGKLELDLSDGLSTSGHTLFVYPGHTVRGQATEKLTGAPLPDVRIRKLWSREKPTLTDFDGRYTISSITSGELLVTKEGFRLPDTVSERTDNSGPSRSQAIPLQLGDELEITRDFEMVESITVSGRVSLVNGDAVPGSIVTIESKDRTAFEGLPITGPTNPDGSFHFEVLPYTSLAIMAEAPGFAKRLSSLVQVVDTSVTGVVILLDAGGTIEGVVVDPKGNPLPDSEVVAMDQFVRNVMGSGSQIAKVQSDAKGRFSISNIPTEGAELTASHEGFANSDKQRVKPQVGETITNIRLELRNPHFIAGRVMDKEKKPIDEARVGFVSKKGDMGHTVSDKDGKYRVDGLPEGDYWGSCTTPSGQSVHKETVKLDQANVDFIFETEPSKTSIIIGKVLDATTRRPVARFKVLPEYVHAEISPDKPGEFRLVAERPDILFSVTVMADGYLPVLHQFASASIAGEVKEVEYLMGKGGSIIGRVLNKSDNKPLAGVTVSLSSDVLENTHPSQIYGTRTQPVVTVEDGQFIFEKVLAGEREVEVKFLQGKAPLKKKVTVEHGKISDVGDLLVGTGGTVRVRAVRDPGGKPAEGVRIRAYGKTGPRSMAVQMTLTTGADGMAVFANLPPNTYSFSHENIWFGYELNVVDDASLDLTLRLGGVTLTGLVMDRDEPALMGSVRLMAMDGDKNVAGFSGTIGPEGRYSIKNLPAGTYRATASTTVRADGSQPKAETTVVIAGNGDQVLDFTIPNEPAKR